MKDKKHAVSNAYTETYCELEKVILYCKLSDSYNDAKKKITKIANILNKEKDILKKASTNDMTQNEINEFLSKNSSYTAEEFIEARELALTIQEITQKSIGTFSNRIETIININDNIKKYFINKDKIVNKPISYSEALTLKKQAKDDANLIDEAVQWLESEEDNKGKRPSHKVFEKWLKEKSGYQLKNRGIQKSQLSIIKDKFNSISESDLNKLSADKKLKVKEILNEMNIKLKYLEGIVYL